MKRRLHNISGILSSIFLLSFLSITNYSNGQNLVQNGNFTTQPANQWVAAPPGTTTETYAFESTYGGASTTNRVAEVDNTSTLRQTAIAVNPGEKYYFSYIRSRRTAGGGPNPNIVNIKVYNGATNFMDRTDNSTNTSFAWTCAVDSFVPTTNTVDLDFINTSATSSTLGTIVDSIIITPEYQPTAITNGTICQGNNFRISLPLVGSNIYTNFMWTLPNGTTSTDSFIDIVNADPTLHNGLYTCEMSMYNTCLKVKAQIAINITSVNGSQSFVICQGDSVPYFNTYLFNAGVYDTVLVSSQGCDSFLTTTVQVVPKPERIFMLDSIVTCQYENVALESNAIPYNSNYTYSWSPSTNLNVDNQPNVYFFADQSRRYILTVSNTDNAIPCSISDTIDIIVNPGDFLVLPFNDTAICPTDSVQLIASGADAYKWSPSFGLNYDTVSSPMASPWTTTKYTLIGSSLRGCTDTQYVNVTVHPEAVLEIPEYINLFMGEKFALEPNTNATHFAWFPYSGINAINVSNPILSPIVDTRYFVTATTENGCTISDSIDVWVKGSVIDMPNAFNPNDGTFKPVYRGDIQLQSFEIFNRWGEKLFETQNLNQGWDGSFNSKPQPLGAYVYSIKAITSEGKEFKKTGSVTLIR